MTTRTDAVWTTADRARFFIIPVDSDLPAGSLTLGAGVRSVAVDPDAAAAYEVDAEAARAHANHTFRRGWDTLRDRLPGARLPDLDGLLGAEPAQVIADAGAARDAVRRAAEQIASAAGHPDPARVIDERLARLRADLDDEDGRVARAAKGAAQRLEQPTRALADRLATPVQGEPLPPPRVRRHRGVRGVCRLHGLGPPGLPGALRGRAHPRRDREAAQRGAVGDEVPWR